MNNKPNRGSSLFRTNLKTSEKFQSYADRQFEKKREKERKDLLNEIDRRNSENDYNV